MYKPTWFKTHTSFNLRQHWSLAWVMESKGTTRAHKLQTSLCSRRKSKGQNKEGSAALVTVLISLPYSLSSTELSLMGCGFHSTNDFLYKHSAPKTPRRNTSPLGPYGLQRRNRDTGTACCDSALSFCVSAICQTGQRHLLEIILPFLRVDWWLLSWPGLSNYTWRLVPVPLNQGSLTGEKSKSQNGRCFVSASQTACISVRNYLRHVEHFGYLSLSERLVICLDTVVKR